VRIVAASNKDIAALVKQGKFREDLYYRVSVFPIKIPALRERKDDIPLLVEHFVRKLKTNKTISAAAVDRLKEYDWPGNIRELENTLERANIIAQQVIQPEHILLPEIRRTASIAPAEKNLKSAGSYGKETAEAEIIRHTLEQTKGNKSEAARRLGVSYKTLLSRIARYQQKHLL
jgi:DNA-binding NtrC family response regulator